MKIAIVTGASSGMGREFVRQLGYFYKNLDEIWVIARRKERLEALAKESRVPLRIFAGDLQKKKVYKELRDALEKEQPDLRMLVNSAGFGKSGSVEEILSEKFRIQTDMVDVNCRSLTRMTLLCLPFLRAGSRIVNLASASAFCPQPYFSVYAATKSYVLSFSRSLGEELRKKGIVVTAVCPGPVDTEFFKFSGETAEYLEETDNGEGRQSGSSGVEGLQIREVSLRLWNPNEINLLWNKTAATWISRAYAANMNLE